MVDFLWGALTFILRAINLVLRIVVTISRMQRLARLFTGSDAIVTAPPEPKILSPAAQRALAEAEARRNGRASFIDKCVSPSCK
ncbi:hypothetical protein [Afipia sp. GAS231]|uniref:hypothetical protein n=1 Tax=Afipia sp. GAS231 TaxID=1882747 RepID=UPI0008797C62|nr:hypothetical protein [Afipia sp. GAS231]SDN69101.1 hypothetical protein SAMN05444050_2183 [Afipia sp. GAS231]